MALYRGDTMPSDNPDLKKTYKKAKSYLSDHVLEFYELYDLFCSKGVRGAIDTGSTNGGEVYGTIIEAFQEKYEEVLKTVDDPKMKDESQITECEEKEEYLDLFISLMDDNKLTPGEIYVLETHAKAVDSNKKYDLIRSMLDYQQSLKSLYVKKGKIDDFDVQAKKLREDSGFSPLQLIKIESKVTLERVKGKK